MTQFLRPVSDISDGTWTGQDGGTDLYTYVDEVTADDATTFIRDNGSNSTCEVQLSSGTDPGVDTNFVWQVRYRKNTSGGAQRGITLTILHNGSTVKTVAFTNISNTWTTYNVTMDPTTEAALITNFAQVSVRFESTTQAGGTARQIHVTWTELALPDAGAGGRPDFLCLLGVS